MGGSARMRATPVAGAYVRLLDAGGEFTAEVVTSPAGQFRFFAAPGTWTLRALSRHGNGDRGDHRRSRPERGGSLGHLLTRS